MRHLRSADTLYKSRGCCLHPRVCTSLLAQTSEVKTKYTYSTKRRLSCSCSLHPSRTCWLSGQQVEGGCQSHTGRKKPFQEERKISVSHLPKELGKLYCILSHVFVFCLRKDLCSLLIAVLANKSYISFVKDTM